ncbi:MAG: alkaline phosphatase D family protein [Oligoflexus sp.]|nr:alkaline phosphatase D family protein [Oligoflexus sp.]
MSLSRRQLFGVGSGFCGLFLGQNALAQDSIQLSGKQRKDFEELSEVFAYGVASGDPLQDRVILWTHVGDLGDEFVSVEWQVALDPYFVEVVSVGELIAKADHDYTVKVDAILPIPGTTYYYRFRAHGYWSPVGRTRTAPVNSDHLRIAVASCSSIWSGYFNSYALLARRADLDLVVHCGDYTYDCVDKDELRNLSYLAKNQQEPVSLEDRRQRYRYYRLDPHLRAAHQQHPWAVIWDNHDICTLARRADSIQAFFEWLPVRSYPQTDRIYRSLDFGDLLKVVLLDTRHIGRNQAIPGTNDLSILGEEQFKWLKDELKNSQSKWTVIVNQVLMSPLNALGKVLAPDAWGGYPKDRERLLKFIIDEGIKNTIVVSGDAHFSFACNLEVDGKAAGVEFLPTSITRGNLDETLGSFLGTLLKGTFEAAIKLCNPSTRYFESEAHGYGIVDIKASDANCEFWYVDHRELCNIETCSKALNVEAGANYFTLENAPVSNPKLERPRLAPSEQRLYEKGLEVGGQDGESFDGMERLQKNSRLSSVRLCSDKKLLSVGCFYEEGLSWQKGGSGGKVQTLVLASNEYFVSMKVGVGQEMGKVIVSYLKLETSLGRVLEAGALTKDLVSFEAPEGRHIVSFYGRSSKGKRIDKIGPVYAVHFNRIKPT